MDKKGVTLLEIVISVALFAIITSALVSVFITATSLNKKSFEYKEVELAMREVVESKKTSGQVTIDGIVFQIQEIDDASNNLLFYANDGSRGATLSGNYYRVINTKTDLYYDYFIGQ